MNKMTKKHNKKQLAGTPNNSDIRAKEFLQCLGNGKPIHQCENEDYIQETAITSQLPKQPPITPPAALKTLLERYKRGDVE